MISRLLAAALIVSLAAPAFALDSPKRRLGVGPVLEMTGTDEHVHGDPWIGIDDDGRTQIVFAITIGGDTLIVRRGVVPGAARLASAVLMNITNSTVPPENFRVHQFRDEGSLFVAHGSQVVKYHSSEGVTGPLTAAGDDAHVGMAFNTVHVISTVATPDLGTELVAQLTDAATFSALTAPLTISRRLWDPLDPPPEPRGSQHVVVRSVDFLRVERAIVIYDQLELAARIGVTHRGVHAVSVGFEGDAFGDIAGHVTLFDEEDAASPLETTTAQSGFGVLYVTGVVTSGKKSELILKRLRSDVSELETTYRGPIGLDAAQAGGNATRTFVGVLGYPGSVLWSGPPIRRPTPTHKGGVFLDRIASSGDQVYRARILRARRSPLPAFSIDQLGGALVAWTTGRAGKRNRLRLRRVTRKGRVASEITLGARVDPSHPIIAPGDDFRTPPSFAVAWTARTRRSERRRLFVVVVASAD